MNKVYLVGAGPGDPELVTWKGRRLIESADSILYDNLAPQVLLNLAPPGTELVYVGKKKSKHTFQQEEISQMLVDRARAGKTVVRLKGGDPFVFGRGGEEVEALADAGIDFEVVPGVTTPVGIAAYCGVPLTHREHTSVVTFVTGHEVDQIDWEKVGAAATLVLFMALTRFDDIAQRLIAGGKSAATPALVVRWASRPDQQTITGTLADLAGKIESVGMKPPATFIVGDVVGLREKLNWFERLPLFGKRIVITRARTQASKLAAQLRGLGAEVVEFPTIEVQDPDETGPLDTAIENLRSYDWLAFTSVNGVEYFLKRLDASGRDLRDIRGQICAIGPITAKAVEALHLKVDVMPKEFVAESLVEAFEPFEMDGKRVLLPRAKVARNVLPEALRERGAVVDVVPAYQTVMPAAAPSLAEDVFQKPVDWVLFTSSSTVKNFMVAAGAVAFASAKVASIGPVTSATARDCGIDVAVEAEPYTIDGLVNSILDAEKR
jgi:uroporphyrinogen III methyltransferase / synthase